MSLKVASHSPHFPLSHNVLQGQCYLQHVFSAIQCLGKLISLTPLWTRNFLAFSQGHKTLRNQKEVTCHAESCHANRRLLIILMISNSRRDLREEVGCEYIMSAQFASECSDTFTSLNGPRLTKTLRSLSFGRWSNWDLEQLAKDTVQS